MAFLTRALGTDITEIILYYVDSRNVMKDCMRDLTKLTEIIALSLDRIDCSNLIYRVIPGGYWRFSFNGLKWIKDYLWSIGKNKTYYHRDLAHFSNEQNMKSDLGKHVVSYVSYMRLVKAVKIKC